jgi:hypothetical protein
MPQLAGAAQQGLAAPVTLDARIGPFCHNLDRNHSNKGLMMFRAYLLASLLVFSVTSHAIEPKPRPTPPHSWEDTSEPKMSSPTLKETCDWLREKLMASAGGTFAPGGVASEEKYDEFKFEGCAVSFRSIFKIKGKLPFEKDSQTSFSLSDIDPATVAFFKVEKTPGLLGVSMKTESGADKVTVKTLSRAAGEGIKRTSSISITIPDEAIARRVAKAFQQASTLCRSRKEAF